MSTAAKRTGSTKLSSIEKIARPVEHSFTFFNPVKNTKHPQKMTRKLPNNGIIAKIETDPSA